MKNYLVVAVVAVASQAGVAAAAPGWCKDAKFESTTDLNDLKVTEAEHIYAVIRTVVKATCKPDPEVKNQAGAVESRRQQLGKQLGMNDADWADAVAFTNDEGSPQPIPVSTRDFASMTPLDQYQVVWEGIATAGGNHFDDYNYLVDVFEPALTEVGRLGFIKRCIASRSTSVTDDAVQYALCQGDIDGLDVAKFATQLRADTAHDAASRMQARIALYAFKMEDQAAHKKVVDGILKKDAAYKKLWDNAKAGRDEWKTTFGADTAGLSLIQKMDSGYFFASRKMFEGCQDITGKALDAAIAKFAPTKTFKDLHDTRKDPYEGTTKVIGPALAEIPQIYWAAMPYVLCQPKTMRGDYFAYYIQERPGYRGPHAGALSKMWDNAVVLDDMNAKVLYPKMSRPYDRSGGLMGSAGGVVKSVKAENGQLTVELEFLPVKIDVCVKSHSTGRISRINWDSGAVEYGSVCDKSETKTINDQWAPFHINKKYAPLIKKGVRISAIYGSGPDGAAQAQGSDLIATSPNKTASLPDTVMGVPVK